MKTQEQSSISKEIPKLKPALEEKYKAEPKKEVTKETTKLPQPTGWRMLVLPFRMKERTDGGIRSDNKKAANRRKSYCARSAGQLRNSSAKTRNDPNSRIRQARRRWKC